MKKRIFLAALTLGLSVSACAQEKAPAQPAQPAPKRFVIGNSEIVPLHSASTGQDHEIIIMYPDSYWQDPKKTYPVLYFLDAYWHTPIMNATYGSLRYDKMVPEFIMVGLSNPDGTDYNRTRVRDYTFTSILFAPGSGKGDKFLDFIEKEVAPLIETKYRGQKENRVLAGASLGGSFTLGAALKTPDFFNGYIALSPAVVWDDGAIFKAEEAFAKQNRPLKARMFISAGSLEPAQFRDPITKYEQQLLSHKYPGLELQSYVMQDLAHATVNGEGYIRGLKWVWQGRQ